MKLGIFVTGTNTGIGKTIVSSLLVSSLKHHSIKTGYFKPIQTGIDCDTPTVSELTGIPLSKLPEPAYSFSEPIDPFRASRLQDKQVQLDYIEQKWKELDNRAWVVEGAGGLLVPLNSRHTTRDLICALELKILVVASTRLGTINHTLLTIEAARSWGISIAGIVLVGEEDASLATLLTDFSRVPVLTRVPFIANLSQERDFRRRTKTLPNEFVRGLI